MPSAHTPTRALPSVTKLLAFDLDGTLADTESLTIPNLMEQLAADYNLHLTPAQWHASYHGMAGSSLIDRLNADFADKLAQPIEWASFAANRKVRIEKLFQTSGVPPAPGMLQMIRRLLGAGHLACVVSNSNPARIALTLEVIQGQRQHGVLLPAVFEGHIFSGIDPAMPNRASKPAPDAYLAAAQAYQLNPNHCMAFEDSITGVQAAVAAGFTCWGYTGLATDKAAATNELSAAGASHVFSHWDEVSA